MPQSAKLNESVKLCSHLEICYTNIDRITRHFPEYFNESSEVNDVNEHGNIEDINTDDDATLNSDLVSNFDQKNWFMVIQKGDLSQTHDDYVEGKMS